MFDRIIYSKENRAMSNGMRMYGHQPLSNKEIIEIKKEIRILKADESLFVFNDENHLSKTCYNFIDDIVYIGRNVYPDTVYGSTHPRDLMSIRAVLAHEYYGHRIYRNEYLEDIKHGTTTTSMWQDECRASITASKIAPGLELKDRIYLIQDAIKRAEEFGQWIQLDEYMKGVLFYGYSDSEKNITSSINKITFVGESGEETNVRVWESGCEMPKMQYHSKGNYSR